MEQLLKPSDVVNMLGISYMKVWRMSKSGELPAIRVGEQWRYRPSDIEKYLKKNTQKAKAA